jgi:hypothetical protein
MTKAKERTKQIDVERKELDKIWLPSQLMMMFGMLANMLSEKDVLPKFLTSENTINVVLFISFVGLSWVFYKGWKLAREKDTILSKYGIW